MGDLPVLVPNAAGTLSGITCIIMYLLYSELVIPFAYMAVCFAIVFTAIFCIFALKGQEILGFSNVQIVGLIGCTMSVIMMGSPLSALSRIISEKSTRSMPFYTSLSAFLNGLGWSSYGLLICHDYNIYGPNLVGLSLATVQLALYAIYGFDHRKEDKKAIIKMKSRTVRALSFNNLDLLVSEQTKRETGLDGYGAVSTEESLPIASGSLKSTSYPF